MSALSPRRPIAALRRGRPRPRRGRRLIVRAALAEDLGTAGDITSAATVPADADHARALRQPGERHRRRASGAGRGGRHRARPATAAGRSQLLVADGDPLAPGHGAGRDQRTGAGRARARAHLAEPARPPVRRSRRSPRAGSTRSRAPARRSATPARPRRCCASWTSTRCAAAAGSTTAAASTTPC